MNAPKTCGLFEKRARGTRIEDDDNMERRREPTEAAQDQERLQTTKVIVIVRT